MPLKRVKRVQKVTKNHRVQDCGAPRGKTVPSCYAVVCPAVSPYNFSCTSSLLLQRNFPNGTDVQRILHYHSCKWNACATILPLPRLSVSVRMCTTDVCYLRVCTYSTDYRVQHALALRWAVKSESGIGGERGWDHGFMGMACHQFHFQAPRLAWSHSAFMQDDVTPLQEIPLYFRHHTGQP